MRVVLVAALLLAALAIPATAASTVWNTNVPLKGGAKKVTVIGDNPNTMLPLCRCVAGTWKLAKKGESATHFAGTLSSLSFNHKRAGKQKTLSIKVRKTRDLMGVQQDYRGLLHGTMRGSGQLILREVKGGDWEIVGFSAEKLGDLFGLYKKWRTDGDKAPALTAPSPLIDPAADAEALVKLINDYRASIKLPRVAVSKKLTKVAEAHVRDLNVNKPVKEGCNMHSWSDKGKWTSCCYDSSKAAAKCMWVKPKEIAGYAGHGYEIAAGASGIEPARALKLWQDSPAHHAVMINKDLWKKPWGAIGVAIEGDFAVAWFGEQADE
jgi:hypothetical protein